MQKRINLIILYEDETALTTEPLSLTRPVWDFRCGIRTLVEKIVSFFPDAEIVHYTRSHLQNMVSNPFDPDKHGDNGTLWVNGNLIPGSGFASVTELKEESAWILNGRIAAFKGRKPRTWEAGTPLPAESFKRMKAPADAGTLVRYPWDLVSNMNSENAREARELRELGECRGTVHKTAVLSGSEEIYVGESCILEPGVVIDSSHGPVVLDDGVIIGANAVIEGPTYLGHGTQIKPLAHIRGSCLGEQSRAGGEISISIMQGYSNKGHGGFLGHSFIGEWCNLGSGTETSNLKNNYSPVKVQIGSELVDTGQMFVGLTMGDHSKSAIGSIFNTGAVVGVGCIIFGAGFPPRHIPSFNWGGADKLTKYPLKPSLQTAKEVMLRRHKELTAAEIEVLSWIHKNRSSLPGNRKK